MGYGHSFSESFYYDEDARELPEPGKQPTTVAQALMCLDEATFNECCADVGVNPESDTVIEELIDVVRQTDYVDSLSSPITVYIDPDGYFTVTVYD